MAERNLTGEAQRERMEGIKGIYYAALDLEERFRECVKDESFDVIDEQNGECTIAVDYQDRDVRPLRNVSEYALNILTRYKEYITDCEKYREKKQSDGGKI